MKDEIKEILDKFDKVLENYELDKKWGQMSVDSICHLFPSEMVAIKDYITNLQEKDKEIERLNEELGDANYTITQLHKVMDRHHVKKEDYDRLNNIINGYENIKKELLDYIYHNEYCRFGHIDGEEADEMREIISKTDKLKALKEGKE